MNNWTQEERSALQFLERQHPNLAATYASHLPKARRSIQNRVTAALEREASMIEVEFAYGQMDGPFSQFNAELSNGMANLAMCYAFHEEKKQRLQQQARSLCLTTSLDYALRLSTDDAVLFFEQLCIEGHNLHPGAKTKLGLTPEDVYRYSAEFEGAPDVRFVGIRQDFAFGSDANAILFADYPHLQDAANREFAKKGLCAGDYLFVPVHPWQLENCIPCLYADELASNIVVPVESAAVPTRATSSFRTVLPAGDKHALKLAVNAQMTSTVRSISPQTAHNASLFTELIREVMKREEQLTETFIPICEVAGYHFQPQEKEADPAHYKLQTRNLTAVLRESMNRYIKPGELAIVGTALYAESPISEKPILVELIESYAHTIRKSSLKKAALCFLSEYAALILPGFLTLMVRYGIGLEGHLQNSVPVFRDGRPVRFLFRDWGGVRIYEERLHRQGLRVSFAPGSVTVTRDVREMQNKVLYTVFQNHLAELILQASRYFGVSESLLWREVRRITDDLFAKWEDSTQDRQALYQAEVPCKALVAMRFAPEKGDCNVSVANPLHFAER